MTLSLAFIEGIGGPELMMIMFVVLLLFGANRLPELARGIGTDRLIVDWRIASPRVERALAGEPPRGIALFVEGDGEGEVPVINPHGEIGALTGNQLPDLPRVRVEIPSSIQALKAAEPQVARVWRRGTRIALGGYLRRGYRLALFYREAESGRCFYGLER